MLLGVTGCYGLAKAGGQDHFVGRMSFAGESASPGDVAMARWIELVGAFAEDPFLANEVFAQREIIRADILLGAGETLFGGGKLVHQAKSQLVLFGPKVGGAEPGGKCFGRFPADLPPKAGLVADGFAGFEPAQKGGENRLEKIPIVGATGEEAFEPELVGFELINVDAGQIAFA